MINKATQIIGHKILTIDSGIEIGEVRDVVYDPSVNKVRAILVEKGGILSEAKVILMENVSHIGPDKVMVKDESVINKISNVGGKVEEILKDNESLTQSKVVTETGIELGKITDIYFDDTNGNVEEFEVSGSVIDNVKSGKKTIHINNMKTVGPEIIVVTAYTEDELKDQDKTSGLTGVAHTIAQKAGDIADTVKEKASETKDKVEQQGIKAKMQATEKMDDAKSQVKDEDNQQKVKDGINSFGNVLGEKLTQAKEKVAEFADKSKEKIEETKASADKTIETKKNEMVQNQKREVLGKVVTINVVGEDGVMYAERGTIITPDLLDKAEKAGVIKNVLSNTTDELKTI